MSLRKLKDGRYRYRFLASGSKTGKYAQKTLPKGTTHADAKKQYLKDCAAATALRGAMTQTITFAELAALYVKHADMADSSRERAEEIVRLSLSPTFGPMNVGAIKPKHVKTWQIERRGDAEAATVNREWNTFRAILNYGEAQEIIERNPIARNAVKPLAAETVGRDAYFEPEEWRRFLAVFDNANAWRDYLKRRRREAKPRGVIEDERPNGFGKGTRRPDSDASREYFERLRAMVPIFRAKLYAAARIDELLTLKWGAIDYRRNTITVIQPKTRRKVATPKTLPMCAPLRALLLSLPQGVGDARVFRKPDGAPYTYMEVNRAFRKGVTLAGLNSALTLHSVRHTVGSWLTIAGHPERHISDILGHARSSVTSRYSHLRKDSLVPILADLCRIEAEGFRPDEQMTDDTETVTPKPISFPVTS